MIATSERGRSESVPMLALITSSTAAVIVFEQAFQLVRRAIWIQEVIRRGEIICFDPPQVYAWFLWRVLIIFTVFNAGVAARCILLRRRLRPVLVGAATVIYVAVETPADWSEAFFSLLIGGYLVLLLFLFGSDLRQWVISFQLSPAAKG